MTPKPLPDSPKTKQSRGSANKQIDNEKTVGEKSLENIGLAHGRT